MLLSFSKMDNVHVLGKSFAPNHTGHSGHKPQSNIDEKRVPSHGDLYKNCLIFGLLFSIILNKIYLEWRIENGDTSMSTL